MTRLGDKEFWKEARDGDMIAARECRDALTNPEGHWRYDKDAARVKEAVGSWVRRARNAHELAMGRRPVIEKVVVITNSATMHGQLLAK